MWASKTVFIDRANSKHARATFDNAAHVMRSEQQSVFIFPEGTRSYYQKPDLLPFKKGAFHLAVQAQVPIVPIVAANYSNILTMKGGSKSWSFKSGRIPIKVLEPISTEGLKADSVDELLKTARERMLVALKEMDMEQRDSKLTDRNGRAVTASGVDGRANIAMRPI